MSAWKARAFARGRPSIALELYHGHGVDLTATEARELSGELADAANEVDPQTDDQIILRLLFALGVAAGRLLASGNGGTAMLVNAVRAQIDRLSPPADQEPR